MNTCKIHEQNSFSNISNNIFFIIHLIHIYFILPINISIHTSEKTELPRYVDSV